jgi:predicted signal transduction protein with EAL and GGDEF domain
MVARLGGDEFTILLEDLHDQEEAEEIALRVLDSLRSPVFFHGKEAFACASIGITYTDKVSSNSETLMVEADLAMYRAKANGKFGYAFFDESMSIDSELRLELESSLRRAVVAKQISVHFQPLIDLNTGALVGAEALARWKTSDRGFISPEIFIPIAEETGLVVDLGYEIMRSACQQALSWIESGLVGHFVISVNLSGKQILRPDLVDRVAAVLTETGLPPGRLKLEITESILMSNRDGVVEKLQGLKDLGVSLALDDFGTGYSSLATLSIFPIDTLKIDRGFILNLGEDREPLAIVRAILALSKTMKMDVVAEGVETEHQAEVIRRLGCRTGQGYLYSKPMTGQDFSNFLEAMPTLSKAA